MLLSQIETHYMYEKNNHSWCRLYVKESHACMHALDLPVDIVPKKQIVGLRWEAAVLEQAEQIGKLAVDVANDLDGGGKLEKHGLGQQQLSGSEADHPNLGFGHVVDQRPGRLAAGGEELVDDAVNRVDERDSGRGISVVVREGGSRFVVLPSVHVPVLFFIIYIANGTLKNKCRCATWRRCCFLGIEP